jgi:hypothetical protein
LANEQRIEGKHVIATSESALSVLEVVAISKELMTSTDGQKPHEAVRERYSTSDSPDLGTCPE